MNCGTLKSFMSHKAANTPPCKWCAPYNPKLTAPKKEVVVRAKPKAKAPPKPRATSQAVCGTTPGYHAHRTANEKPCDPCRLALNEYQRKHYKAKKAANP